MRTKEQIRESLLKDIDAQVDKIYKEEKDKSRFGTLNGFKFVYGSDDRRVSYECDNLKDIANIISTLPTSASSFELGFAHKDSETIQTGYKLRTQSVINEQVMVKLQYEVGDNYVVQIQFSSFLISDFLVNDTRRVTDSELHYFGGVSRSEIDKCKIPCARFRDSSNQGYYGGDYVCTSPPTAEKIIEFILSHN